MRPTVPESLRGDRKSPADTAKFLLVLAVAASAFLCLMSVFWIGFLGSDDSLYWEGAGGWMNHIPYVGRSHWTLRHTLVIPMAIMRSLLGNGLPALLLPSILAAIGCIVVLAFWTWRAAGLAAAALAAAAVITNPQFVLLSSTACVDVVEMLFVFGAFAIIALGMAPGDRGPPASLPPIGIGRLLTAGVLLGLAALSRETSFFAMAALGCLFLAGYGMPRRCYVIVGFTFGAVVALEMAWLWLNTGDPLYRLHISARHDIGNEINRWVNQGASIPIIHPAIDPITMLLLNHNFGLLTWIGVPSVIWLIRRGKLEGSARHLVVMGGTLVLVWTVITAGLWKLPLIPRYFMLPAVMLAALTGVALVRQWQLGWHRLPVFLAALLLGTNVLALSLDNINFMYGQHVLVDIAEQQAGVIHTDRTTLRRARLLLEWKQADSRVTSSPPAAGDLFFYNPAWGTKDVQPAPDWIVVERRGLPEPLRQRLARALLPPGLLSPGLLNRLGPGHPDVVLYRLP